MNCWVNLLLLIALSGAPLAHGLKVATIQFESRDGAFEENLATATKLIQQAKKQGAQLVLLPEFALIGYQLSSDMWHSGENIQGSTLAAFSSLAKKYQLYLGTTLLEVEGEDFYNTFVVVDPAGKLLGSVRKHKPAGAEGYFFKGHKNHHVIDSPIGAIGVGICQENSRCFLPKQLHLGGATLCLCHSLTRILVPLVVLPRREGHILRVGMQINLAFR